MSITESFLQKEASLISELRANKAGIDDRTGKRAGTESTIESELLTPFLPPGFECGKGSVVTAEQPDCQSPAIDRVIFDRASFAPLLHDAAHSIYQLQERIPRYSHLIIVIA